MSRVIKKLAEGGTSENKRTFTYAGNTYDIESLKNEFAKLYKSERDSWKYSNRELQLLDDGFSKIIDAMNSDGFGRDISGSWENTAGLSSSGINRKNIFGRLKNTEDNSLNLAASLLDKAFSRISPYSESKKESQQESKKKTLDLNLKNLLHKRLMPNESEWSSKIWTDLEGGVKDSSGKLSTTNRQKAIREALLGLADEVENSTPDTYEYQEFITNPKLYATQLRELVTKGAFKDNIGDAGDLSALSRLGIVGLDGLLQDQIEESKANNTSKPQSQINLEKANEENQRAWNNFLEEIKLGDQNKQWGIRLNRDIKEVAPTTALFEAVIPNTDYFHSTVNSPMVDYIKLDRNVIDRPVRPTHIAGLKEQVQNYLNTDSRSKDFTEGDYNYIIPTISDDMKYILRYNKNTNTLQRVLTSESPKVLEYIKRLFMKNRDANIANRREVFESGGILKAQYGALLDEENERYFKESSNAKSNQSAKPKTLPKRTQSEVTSQEANRKPLEDGLEWDDYTRLGALASDITGMIAGFVPGVGNVISTGSGFLSTGANFAADLKDGIQMSDLGNAAISLGLDIASVIPGLGIGAKGSKITKNLIRWVPKLLPIFAAQQNLGSAADAVLKITKNGWKSLTVDDWKNLAYGLNTIATGSRAAARGAKATKLESTLKTGNKSISGTKGSISLTPEQFKEFKKTKSVSEANEYLKKIGIDNTVESTMGPWYNPNRYLTDYNEYDFTKYIPNSQKSNTITVKNDKGKLITITDPKKFSTNESDRIVANMKSSTVREALKNQLSQKTITPRKIKTKTTQSEVDKNTKRYSSVAGSKTPNIELIRQKYPKYKDLSDFDLLEQVKDKIAPSSYKAALAELGRNTKSKRKYTPRKKTTSNDTDELWKESIHNEFRDGGIIKYVGGGEFDINPYKGVGLNNISGLLPLTKNKSEVQNGVMDRSVVTDPSRYLQVVNNKKNAQDITTWSNYYNNKLAAEDLGANDWAKEATLEGLNQLHSMQGSIPTELNNPGAFAFNHLFESMLSPVNTNVYGRDIDKFKFQGPSTYNRQALLQEMASKYNSPTNYLNTKDGKIYFDGTKWTKVPEVAQNTEQTKTKVTGAGIQRNKFQFLPEDAIAFGRMLGTINVNNQANKRIQKDLRPTLINTYENYIPQTEDYLAKTSAYNQAADLQRQGRRIANNTSDASLGAAALLEATRQGRNIALQGDLANSQRLYQTGEQGRAESNAAKARRVEVANKNRSAMNQIALAKAQMDAQTNVGNWMQAIQPWAAGMENRLRTQRMQQRQLDLKANELDSQSSMYDGRQGIINKYKNMDMSDPTVVANFQNEMNKLQTDAERKALENTSTIISRGAWLRRPLTSNTLYKKGGKFNGDTILITRAKEFNKALRDQQKNFMREMQSLRREHSQMMRQLSAFTSNLIKSGMSWK